jgi:hypothetical protein
MWARRLAALYLHHLSNRSTTGQSSQSPTRGR